MTDNVNVPREPTEAEVDAVIKAMQEPAPPIGAEPTNTLDRMRYLARAISASVLAAAPKAEPVSGDWYSAESIDALVLEIDIALNGENAAPQAKLCDLVKQIKELAQPEAPKMEQEPVAWLITNKASGVKDLSFRKLADFPFNHSRFEAEPLYAHHAPFSGELYEALVDLASWFTQPLQGLDGQVWAIPAGERGADEALEVARSLIAKHKGPQS